MLSLKNNAPYIVVTKCNSLVDSISASYARGSILKSQPEDWLQTLTYDGYISPSN